MSTATLPTAAVLPARPLALLAAATLAAAAHRRPPGRTARRRGTAGAGDRAGGRRATR